VGLDADAVTSTVSVGYVVEEDRELPRAGISAALENGNWAGEVRFCNFKTGAITPMLQQIFDVTCPETGRGIGLATISRDITERMRFEEGLRQAQAERSHLSRVAAPGELTASIAHEINQPLSAIVINANVCARILKVQPPDLHELRLAMTDIADSGRRASEVISRIRGLLKKTHSEKSLLNGRWR
jgi:C4-dicarboxylate-specific signal transduction histidine kinase